MFQISRFKKMASLQHNMIQNICGLADLKNKMFNLNLCKYETKVLDKNLYPNRNSVINSAYHCRILGNDFIEENVNKHTDCSIPLTTFRPRDPIERNFPYEASIVNFKTNECIENANNHSSDSDDELNGVQKEVKMMESTLSVISDTFNKPTSENIKQTDDLDNLKKNIKHRTEILLKFVDESNNLIKQIISEMLESMENNAFDCQSKNKLDYDMNPSVADQLDHKCIKFVEKGNSINKSLEIEKPSENVIKTRKELSDDIKNASVQTNRTHNVGSGRKGYEEEASHKTEEDKCILNSKTCNPESMSILKKRKLKKCEIINKGKTSPRDHIGSTAIDIFNRFNCKPSNKLYSKDIKEEMANKPSYNEGNIICKKDHKELTDDSTFIKDVKIDTCLSSTDKKKIKFDVNNLAIGSTTNDISNHFNCEPSNKLYSKDIKEEMANDPSYNEENIICKKDHKELTDDSTSIKDFKIDTSHTSTNKNKIEFDVNNLAIKNNSCCNVTNEILMDVGVAKFGKINFRNDFQIKESDDNSLILNRSYTKKYNKLKIEPTTETAISNHKMSTACINKRLSSSKEKQKNELIVNFNEYCERIETELLKSIREKEKRKNAKLIPVSHQIQKWSAMENM